MGHIAANHVGPVATRNSRATLERLLSEVLRHPDRQAEIIQTIESVFRRRKAVMVLDMSGFSRTTQRHGIISFLLMIHQMQLIARPCVEEKGGLVIKADADNLFCLFDTVAEAVGACREIIERLDAANLVLPEDQHLYAAFGIGYGDILNVDDEDIFGNEVNLASKLGEDVARKGEVLLTTAARAELEGTGLEAQPETVSISGLELDYYVVER
jgi:class 3 adenylate cyclase